MMVSTCSDELIIKAFAKIDRFALGIAVGGLFSLCILAATILLVIKGGDHIGQHLSLLQEYFVGYDLTLKGSIIGLIYGSVLGFILGWTFAFLRNFFLAMYIRKVRLASDSRAFSNYMDDL